MELNSASITILVSHNKTTIEIRDNDACTLFCRVELTPEQLSLALSRLSNTPCKASVYGLNKIGLKHQNERFIFEIPKELRSSSCVNELNELCIKELARHDMSEWIPDKYYASQDSFFTKDNRDYASAVIRRYIK